MSNIGLSLVNPLLSVAKWCYTTRRVQREDAFSLSRNFDNAQSGDLVLARVKQIGSHRRVQLTSGRHSDLYPDDLVVAACGARYASDQFEGIASIDPDGIDLLAGGGCFGKMRVCHQQKKSPTRLTPLGLLMDSHQQVLNLARYAIAVNSGKIVLTCVGVVGAAMNAGKTTAAAALVRGLVRAGHRVAAIKATGTGSFGDLNAYRDAGAHFVGDFTDAGMASTYLQPVNRIVSALRSLVAVASDQGCDLAVIEFADGVLQREAVELLGSEPIQSMFETFLYAAGDPLSALGGQLQLSRLGIRPAAITGLLTASPLAAIEAQSATGLPVVSKEQLAEPTCACAFTHVADRWTSPGEMAA